MRTWMAAACLLGCVAAAAVARAEAPALDGLGFMEGHWAGVTGDLHMEEHWTSAAGGALIGMHKDVKAGKLSMFEFLRIQVRADGIYYMASPGGRQPTPFMLVEQSDRRVVFENPEHDFPQRITYWSTAPGELRSRIEGKVEGKKESMEWRWERVSP